MSSPEAPTVERGSLKEAQIKYWTHRLDHVLLHTHRITRLVYLIDAALLAALPFIIKAFGESRRVVGICSLPVFLLSALNFLHTFIIRYQHWWYKEIDARLLTLLEETDLRTKRTWKQGGLHVVYVLVHLLIAACLFLVAMAMCLYGLGLRISISWH